MQQWDERLTRAETVDEVMGTLGEFLRHQREERHDALLPVHCRYIVLTTPTDVQWWLRELEAANAGYGAARMILQTTRGTFHRAWERLQALGFGSNTRETTPVR